jgi:histidyl-tRNA synthetase
VIFVIVINYTALMVVWRVLWSISRCRFTYIMMYYHRICVGYTLMFAAEELESDSVVLKDMKLGSQRTISFKGAVDEVSSLCQ